MNYYDNTYFFQFGSSIYDFSFIDVDKRSIHVAAPDMDGLDILGVFRLFVCKEVNRKSL